MILSVGIIISVVLVVLAVFVSGSTQPEKNSYSRGNVAFDYPKNWQLEDNSENIGTIFLKDPQKTDNYCIIYTHQLSISYNYTVEILKSARNMNIISEKPIEINGLKGVEIVYTGNLKDLTKRSDPTTMSMDSAKADLRRVMLNNNNIDASDTERKFRTIILEKSASVTYVITCSALPSDFDQQKNNFQLIFNSFKLS